MASDTLDATLTSIHRMTPRVKQFVLEVEDHTLCESGVESEKKHRGGEPTEGVDEQTLVGTHL